MRPFLCALVVLAALLAGCRGEPGTSTAGSSGEPTAEPTVARLAPLTGEPADAETFTRPVAAVKIDNARPARPQVGLEHADVVLEELVEGGATRFIAFFHSQDPGTVGPVRSGREVDADLLPAFNPVFGISGAAGVVNSLFDSIGLLTFQEGEVGGAFTRDGTRRSPHNLFVSVPDLWQAAAPLEAIDEAWPYDQQAPAGGQETESVSLNLSRGASASWTWDGTRWLREMDGATHQTADGARIGAENVVIMRVDVTPGPRRDASGSSTVDIAVLGEGDAVILRDGASYAGRWRKTSSEAQFEWLTATGGPLPLAAGQLWIELVPTGAEGAVDLVTVEAEATEGPGDS